MKQNTIRKPVTLTGKGLHTNAVSKIRLMPAPVSSGITIQRMVADLHEPERLTPLKVVDTAFAIHVEIDGRVVKSLEHVLGALYGMEIDNVNIQVWGEEVPAMDGSAWPYVQAIRKAGVKRLKEDAAIVSLKGIAKYSQGNRYFVAFPATNFEICTVVDYAHGGIGRQMFEAELSPAVFMKEVAKAKTFGWKEQIAAQQAKGLIKGGHAQNALLYGPDGLENAKLRTFEDEPVRHKTLDVLGALGLLGGRLRAHVVAVRPGHVVDVAFVKQVYQEWKASEKNEQAHKDGSDAKPVGSTGRP